MSSPVPHSGVSRPGLAVQPVTGSAFARIRMRVPARHGGHMEQQRRNGIGQPAALGPFVAMVLVAALSAALPASAQTVHKCVDAAGHVTLTSSECGAGHRLVASYD